MFVILVRTFSWVQSWLFSTHAAGDGSNFQLIKPCQVWRYCNTFCSFQYSLFHAFLLQQSLSRRWLVIRAGSTGRNYPHQFKDTKVGGWGGGGFHWGYPPPWSWARRPPCPSSPGRWPRWAPGPSPSALRSICENQYKKNVSHMNIPYNVSTVCRIFILQCTTCVKGIVELD